MPKRPCMEAGCPSFAEYRGRCKAHARQRERATHNPDHIRIYNSQKWKNTRRKVLGVCAVCGKRIGEQVDHIIPLAEGGAPFDAKNLQPLCIHCHAKKTRREMDREGR